MTYNDIISIKNLFEAWQEFIRGKKYKKDVSEFSLNLSDNIYKLHYELKNKTYKHGDYEAFNISDPKPRNIHKASVRDRLLHHAICKIIYPYFDKKFIYDSYSSRNLKGTHRAINRFHHFFRKVSINNSRTCWVLKCDIRKFFASVDQEVLMKIFGKHVKDLDIVWLIDRIVSSFSTDHNKGLPLGNLTSQLLVNIYMNEFDQFVKHKLKVKYYIRYADDFVILSNDKEHLIQLLEKMRAFLFFELKLELHPKKVSIGTFNSGIDFLGWVHFANNKVLRTTTKRRMFSSILKEGVKSETIQSYLGLLSHGDTWKLKNKISTFLLNT